VKDAQYLARGMIEQHQLPDGKPVKLPGIVPKLSETPGQTAWIGPRLGAHNAEVLGALGYDAQAQAALKAGGVI
jgi:formyl-CoA transferase